MNAAEYKELLACAVARFQERCSLLADQLAEPHERYRLVPADLVRLQAVVRNAITDIDSAFAKALVEACQPQVRPVWRTRPHLIVDNETTHLTT